MGVLVWTGITCLILGLTGKVCYDVSRPAPPPLPPGVKDEARAEMRLDMARIRGHVKFMSSLGTRIVGSPGNAKTADYIVGELRRAGIDPDKIERQRFQTITPTVGEEFGKTPDIEAAGITLPDGRRVPIYPLWPNLVRTCRTPPEGIKGRLIDGGSGSLADLSGKDINGAFVIVDWNCDRKWQNVPELGGRAVLFRSSKTTTRHQISSKALTVPANIPRFYVKPEHVAFLEGAAGPANRRDLDMANRRNVDTANRRDIDTAKHRGPGVSTIRCVMAWRKVESENIIARLPATSASKQADGYEQSDLPLILQAYYDSISMVPQLAPGAEQACGPAAMLELARYLAGQNRPRDVILLFTSGHAQAFSGMRAYVSEYLLPPPTGSQFRKFAEAQQPCGLLVSLDLTSGTEQLGIFCKGWFRLLPDIFAHQWFALLGRSLSGYLQPVVDSIVSSRGTRASDGEEKPDLNLFVDGINAIKGANWLSYFPFWMPFESELANLAGVPAVSLATPNDSRDRVDSPMDTFERVRFDRLATQMQMLTPSIDALLNWRGPHTSKKLESLWSTLQGRVVYLHPTKSYIPDYPLPNAMVVLKNNLSNWGILGVRAIPMAMTDEKGRFAIDGLMNMRGGGRWQSRYTVEAFGIDPKTGAVNYASDLSAMRIKDYPNEVTLDEEVRSVSAVVFPCIGTTLYGLTEPREYLRLEQIQIFDAETNSPPFRYGYCQPDHKFYGSVENATTIFAPPNTSLRLGLGASEVGFQMVLTNSQPGNALGAGFDIGQLDTIRAMTLQGASDMYALTQERLDKLIRYGIRNPRAEKLHEHAGKFLEKARAALERHDYVEYRINAESGWATEMKAYPEIRTTANDMIHGVIFYLALLLPFSYAMERLLVAGATIRARIIGMFSVFAVGFAILAVVHPAFRFTLTPVLVLLAFVILVLAVTVSALVLSKFDTMLQEVRTARLGMHEADVNRASAALSAFDLGLSNVRRHKRRAILTATTVIVVTFTLLSFTSMTPTLTVRGARHFVGEPTYSGLLIRDRNWWELSRERYMAYFREMGLQHPVSARAWYYSHIVGNTTRIEVRRTTDPPRLFVARAIIGMSASEPRVTDLPKKVLLAGRWFKDDDEKGVVLSRRMAERLGIGFENGKIIATDAQAATSRPSATATSSSRPASARATVAPTVDVYGRTLPVIGIFDEDEFDKILDLDGEPLTPVDWILMAEKRGKEDPPNPDEVEEYIHYTSDTVPIVSINVAIDVGGTIRSIATRLPAGEVETWTRELTRRTDQTMFANINGTVRLFSTVARTQFGGFFTAAVPVTIGCLIVLSTMLGAVYERKREIFICSSVGLAPNHISSLFLAESCVYAILGASLGYLLGQALTKLMMMFGLLSALSLNYSAMSTVVVTVLTMLVVVATTIYPARVAFRAAIPEEPEGRKGASQGQGDRFTVDLPFLASAGDLVGVQAYLHEFLDAHADVWIGKLSIDQLVTSRREFRDAVIPVLEFRSWLVPFDLGISQHVEIGAVYRADHNAYQYRLVATRKSGDYHNWRRLNPQFLKIIRKQLLLWRILSPEEMQRYVDRGLAVFGADASAIASARGSNAGPGSDAGRSSDAGPGPGSDGPEALSGPGASPAGGVA